MKNKIAIVTGSSRGLGKDMALSLAKKNIDVIVTYNTNAAMALETVKEMEALGAKGAIAHLNMSDFNSLDTFVENISNILSKELNATHFDFLINNAGMGKTVPFVDVTEDVFDDFLNVHFKSIYFLTQKLLKQMNDGGSIINISSGTTRFSNPGYSVYASMKGAMEILTKYLAKELGTRGIRSNIVAPGPVETDFNNAAIRNNPQFKTMLGNMSPLGRVGAADDLGGVIAFLCSDDAKWVNGQRIEVSGGINC